MAYWSLLLLEYLTGLLPPLAQRWGAVGNHLRRADCRADVEALLEALSDDGADIAA